MRAFLRAALLAAPFAVTVLASEPLDPGAAAIAPTGGVFVLGIDGMDPVILQRMMDEGRMPNFERLTAEGSFQELGTSNPPQSPVAWSNFVTGMNPGGHGIYDFLHRDPHNYMPISSATPPIGEDDIPGYISIFGWIVPLGGGEIPNNRSGTPFWDQLSDAGVDVEVYRMPGNYPPTPSEAFTLSGMGTVDMRGTPGTYTWYTSEIMLDTSGVKADVEPVTVEDVDGDGTGDTVFTRIKGPPDVFHLIPGEMPGDDDYLTAPVWVHVSPRDDVVWIKAGGDLDAPTSEWVLEVGEWSPWLEMDFEALPWSLLNLRGMARFYVKQVRPEFIMYASPVNIAPGSPAQPITTPDDGAEALYDELGNYFTQGMPEETNALKDGLLDEDDYVKQVAVVHEDGNAMLDLALDRFDGRDCTFMYLSDIDLQCHMLWRHKDPKDPHAPRHPAMGLTPDAPARWGDLIESYYESVDATLGHVRERLPEDATLIVISDHGFQAFTRKIHVNAWLRDNGYLVLKDGATTGSIALGDVDWSKTRAYGVGFNGIYLNLEGREAEGIVPPVQADALADEIIAGLLTLTDDGTRTIYRADKAADVYSGDRLSEAPDVVIGFDKGYGCSDESTLGEVPEPIIEDNMSRWSGNHLMAPEVVPGVLLSTHRLPGDGHDLTDITATLLDHYGLEPGPGMVGTSIYR